MKKRYFVLLSLLAIFVSATNPSGKSTSKSAEKPSLVIGIVIDQMRYDYLFKYWDKLGEGGFKKLVNEGFLCKDANYNYAPTYTGPGHASIYTGTTPAFHGIISNEWYDRDEEEELYCVGDNSVESVGTTGRAGKMSPVYLRSSTIGDELRLWSNMKSKVIGISLKDRASILPTGHSANAAYWYDASSGNFITSSYYMKTLPEWVKQFNDKRIADEYLKKPWTTMLPIESYTESGEDNSKFEATYKGEQSPVFPHDLPTLKVSDPEIIRKTPFGNSLIKDFAMNTIKSEQLGKGASPDFLSVSFSSTDYVGHQFGPASKEIEDTYIRLDKDLAEFLTFLEGYLGKEHVLVFLTADHGSTYSANLLDSFNIPNGIAETRPMKEELSKYLDEKFGAKEKSWVSSISNNQVFLNRKQIQQNNINMTEISNACVVFLEKQRKVLRCYTASEMRSPQTEVIAGNLQRGWHPKRSGDVLISYEPYYGENYRKGATHGSPYTYDTHVPLLFFGWQVQHGETERRTDITDIAPTISSFLQISAPDACTGNIIQGIRGK